MDLALSFLRRSKMVSPKVPKQVVIIGSGGMASTALRRLLYLFFHYRPYHFKNDP